MTALGKLAKLAEEAAILSSTAAALDWDQETYLPSDGASWRASQLAWLSGRRHELATSAEWEQAINGAIEEVPEEDSRTHGSLREMKRRFDREARLPTQLIERESSLTSRAKHAWASARKNNDFSTFSPFLGQLIDLAQEKAELWGYEDEPYDALLEAFEPGTTTRQILSAFDGIESELRKIAHTAAERSAKQSPTLPAEPYPIEQQQKFNRKVAESLGFDFASGRIDTTTHPFCTTLGPRDVRLTTRYHPSDFTSSLFGVMHEAGHGLYEQGLPAEDFGTASGDSTSLGIHESQSRLWENHIGRSRAFWEKWLPIAAQHFPQLGITPLDDFLKFIRRSEFSFIRVEADEATYDLHILLRFDLERRLLRRELPVTDIPDAWNAAFEKSFGQAPPSDREGCLQDIHWAMGGIGYFPTYSLGNLNAAQLFDSARATPAIADSIDSADYGPLLAWLREKVHAHGASKTAGEIMHSATGRGTEASAYLRHLRRRYLD